MEQQINSLLTVKNSNSQDLINNYMNALKQKYNAVCFDIDGTLTNGIVEINETVLEKLYNLFKKRVPVVFITGRGVTGTKSFVENLVEKLQEKYDVDKTYLSKIFALVNDGTLLLSTTDINFSLFNQETLMVEPSEIQNLMQINEILNNTSIENFERTFSYSSKGALLNIRLVFDVADKSNINQVFDNVKESIGQLGPSTLNITSGIWNNKYVLQIGLSDKEKAIKTVEKIIGVPENSMLRIGDCGSVNGNDYEMLNCNQGFSVRDISESVSGCFPVIDSSGKILNGIDATNYLVESMNILPTICLEKADEESYRKKYAEVERKINIGKVKLFEKYNQLFNKNFNQHNGFNGVFDENTGGIIIPLYEWELIDDRNNLKQLFQFTKNANNSYLLYTDTTVLLRGSENYYYFLKERVLNKEGKEILTKEIVNSWLENCMNFFNKLSSSIALQQDFSTIENRKMLLGIFDCIRNYLLICLNAIITERYPENIMLNFEQLKDNDLLRVMYKLLLENTKIMETLCFENNLFSKEEMLKYISKLIKVGLKFHQEFLNLEDKGDYSKIFRVYREIDNFIENYITIELANSKISKTTHFDKLGVCGLAYGGLELPVIMKAINPIVDNVSVLKFNAMISGYRKKHSVEIRNFCIDDFGGIELFGIDKTKSYVLSDDNLLTAKTMQLAINTMYDKNIDIDSLIIVRYPSMNRINQMFMEGHGAVDPNYFFDYIRGLGFPSPYSYMDLRSSYEDSLGVFDNTRDKILRYLYKNHDFKDNSEVARLRSK